MAVTNWTDRTIVPDNKAAQWALTPLLIPLTVGTLAIDNFLVAPIVHIPSAAIDAYEFVSAPIEGYYSRMGLAPIQLLLTPIVFTGSWIGRSFLAIDPEPEATWAWPEWGRQWIRADGRLVGPPPPAQPEDGP
jgi:hypothetical protein